MRDRTEYSSESNLQQRNNRAGHCPPFLMVHYGVNLQAILYSILCIDYIIKNGNLYTHII